ncbi:MAG: alpha/beta hydrolase-fold protein [Kiritimatiellia bacterium]
MSASIHDGFAAAAAANPPPEAIPAPPAGFDLPRDGIATGRLEWVEYESSTVGEKRPAQVYTPPGYAKERHYPVLYLLHGIGGNEWEWAGPGAAKTILDNLHADGKVTPMIVVLPNGRAAKDVKPNDPIPRQSPAFAAFEQDLLVDLIPFIEARYSADPRREARALAGLSMGGGQSLNFGLAHPDRFAWVGGFSSAPNTRKAAELLPDPAAAKQLKLLWLSCGDRDGLFDISRNVHATLEAKGVPHVWHVHEGGAHDFAVWKKDLYQFAPRLFR